MRCFVSLVCWRLFVQQLNTRKRTWCCITTALPIATWPQQFYATSQCTGHLEAVSSSLTYDGGLFLGHLQPRKRLFYLLCKHKQLGDGLATKKCISARAHKQQKQQRSSPVESSSDSSNNNSKGRSKQTVLTAPNAQLCL